MRLECAHDTDSASLACRAPPPAPSPLWRASASQRCAPLKFDKCSQNLDSPLPTTQGLPGAAVSSSTTPYLQQHLRYTSLQPAAGRPLDTAALLRQARRDAGLLDGDHPMPQPVPQWQHAVPLSLEANGVHGPMLLPPWQPTQQRGLVEQRPSSGQTLNGSSTAATIHQSTGAYNDHSNDQGPYKTVLCARSRPGWEAPEGVEPSLPMRSTAAAHFAATHTRYLPRDPWRES